MMPKGQFSRGVLLSMVLALVVAILVVWLPGGVARGATLTVTNLNDSGAGSLRQAIADAAPGDTIDFGVTGTVTLTTGELVIAKDLTIDGPGSANLTISGNNVSRVFKVSSGTVNISGVTITKGKTSNFGGGIFNEGGTLTLTNSNVSDNTAGGTFSGSGGGGIYNNGTLSVADSTINGNTARNGGGIYHTGTATLTDSSISGNLVGFSGGGIYNSGTLILGESVISGNSSILDSLSAPPAGLGGGIFNTGSLTTTNSTISGNTTVGIRNSGGAATFSNTTITSHHNSGIYRTSGSVTLKNTIVAGNTFFNCGGSIVSNGNNLEDANTCSLAGPGDLSNTDPLLGPLQDNGGPTETHALLSGSPAIDAGDSAACPATDQRGVARPQGAACDIGAFEFESVPLEKLAKHFFPVFRFSAGERYYLTNFYFDDDLNVDNNEDSYDSQRDDPNVDPTQDNTIYIRVVDIGDQLVIQYWLYYANDYKTSPRNGVGHQHDWQHVAVVINKRDVTSGRLEDARPVFVRYSQHFWGMICTWKTGICQDAVDNDILADRLTVDPKDPQRPVVFVAEGSHASFPSPDTGDFDEEFDFIGSRVYRHDDVENWILGTSDTTHDSSDGPGDQAVTWPSKLGGCIGTRYFDRIQFVALKGEHPSPGSECGSPFPDPNFWPHDFGHQAGGPEPPWHRGIDWDDGGFDVGRAIPNSRIGVVIGSPVRFLITDPIGRQLGRDLVTGEIIEEIPDSLFSEGGGPDGQDVVLILGPVEGDYLVEVQGIVTGTYDLTVTMMVRGAVITELTLTDVPISEGEVQANVIEVPEVGGTPGFWLNRAPKLLPIESLDSWATSIDEVSNWLVVEAAAVFPDLTEPVTYADVQTVLSSGKARDMTTKFLRTYAALRLNVFTGFINSAQEVDLSGIDPSGLVFSASPATVAEIIQTIEDRAFFTDQGPDSDERARLEIMKDACELLNGDGV